MFVVMERTTRFDSEVVETFVTEKETYDYIKNLDQMPLEQDIFTGEVIWRYYVKNIN